MRIKSFKIRYRTEPQTHTYCLIRQVVREGKEQEGDSGKAVDATSELQSIFEITDATVNKNYCKIGKRREVIKNNVHSKWTQRTGLI